MNKPEKMARSCNPKKKQALNLRDVPSEVVEGLEAKAREFSQRRGLVVDLSAAQFSKQILTDFAQGRIVYADQVPTMEGAA